MEFMPTDIPDVILIKPSVFGDDRGFFMETWQREIFRRNGIEHEFVQDNHSHSQTHSLRGLHYQIKRPQGKLVRVSRGEVFDVAVDLRQASDTFGRWTGVYLSEANKDQLWIPPGFAHGFYVIRGPADFQYKCTDYYAPEHERCIRWDDPSLAIDWPLVEEGALRVSEKDQNGALFDHAELP